MDKMQYVSGRGIRNSDAAPGHREARARLRLFGKNWATNRPIGQAKGDYIIMSAFESHYTIQEIAEKWHLSEKAVRSLFRDEPGVIKIEAPETRFKRGYCTLRLPESVVQRVHSRLGRQNA